MFNFDERYYESVPFTVTILPKTIELQLPNYQKYVGEKDPVLETDDYILIREVGEEVGNYKLTVKSKSKNYRYEIVANDTFTILDSKQQSIRPEEKKDPLLSINPSNKDKIKYASATDIESNNDIETKVDKNKSCNRCIEFYFNVLFDDVIMYCGDNLYLNKEKKVS